MRNPELWARLSAYEFDTGGGSAPFSVKLARAERWSTAFTAAAIEEYRRFLYLTQISDRQVTPSRTVDAVWHMHLTFTRDYWEDMCPNVIGAPVHHQPCAGEEEMPRYRDQFAATKALYEAEFGIEPPAAYWGGPKAQVKRFALSERGNFTGSPAFIAFIPFAIALVMLLVEFNWILAAITAFTGFMFVMILMTPRRRRQRRPGKRNRRDRGDDGDWIDFGGDDGGSGRTGRSTSVGSKRNRDDDDTRDGGGKGFWASLFDGDGDDGGGCGGCGD